MIFSYKIIIKSVIMQALDIAKEKDKEIDSLQKVQTYQHCHHHHLLRCCLGV